MRVTTVRDAEAAAARAADVVERIIVEACRAHGVCHLALAGGSTPRRCHELLAERRSNWAGVHIWASDERCVPPDSDDSNWKMITESLLDRVSIDESQLHRPRGELGREAAADAYEQEVRSAIWPCDAGDELRAAAAAADGGVSLDIVMCGLGEVGHTLSLFPGHPEVHE